MFVPIRNKGEFGLVFSPILGHLNEKICREAYISIVDKFDSLFRSERIEIL